MRKHFAGGAVTTTLSAQLLNTAAAGATFAVSSTAGWPSSVPFVIAIDLGTASEEKLLISAIAGTTLTIGERGYDGGAAITHAAGATVAHVLDAATIDEANAFVNGAIPTGSASAPSIAFANDPDTGLFLDTPGFVGVVTDGVRRGIFYSGGLAMQDGTAAAPAYTFNSDTNTGIYRSGADAINFSTGGASRLQLGTAGLYSSVPVGVQDGTAAAPPFTFNNDPDTGFYRVAEDSIGVTVGGVLTYRMNSASLFPNADNAKSLGQSGFRWSQLWAGTTTIATSDMDLKAEMQSPLGLEFVRAIQPVTYRFKDGKRPHQGFTAQQVKQAMDDLGIKDFAGYVDPKVGGEEGPLGLRYGEFISPLYKATQELDKKVQRLEARIKELEEQLDA